MTKGLPNPTKDEIAAAERLSALLAAHSESEVEEALPVLFLGAARSLPDLVLSPAAEESIGRFMQKIGLDEKSSPQQMLDALDRHLKESRAPIFVALARFFREESARGGSASQAFATFAGQVAAKGVLDSGARPAGTVAAGPMARFLVKPPKK